MRKTLLAIVFVALSGAPQAAWGQGVGVALRGGSVGIGVEGAVALSEKIAVRAGLGLMPFEIDATIDDIDFTVELPNSWYNIGLDFYPAGGLRIGAGMLFKTDGPTFTATPTTSVEIGGRDFTPAEIGTLKGSLTSGDTAPYALIGFGKHTDLGFGLFVDLGVALLGDPEIELDVEGGNFPDQAELRSRLNAQETELEDDAGSYLSYWPFLSIGLRFGIG